MKSRISWQAEGVRLDPAPAEMKRSRLAAAGSLALRSKLPILSAAVIGATGLMLGGAASAAPTPIGLGTAANNSVLSGTAPTNTGVSTLSGDASSSPNAGGTQPGFGACPAVPSGNCVVYTPPATEHIDDGVANQQQADSTAARITAMGLPATAVPTQLGGTTQVAGVYSFGHDPTANIVGTLTLNAQGDPNSVWIFQASSDLNTATGSSVAFINLPAGVSSAQMACNVFWTAVTSANLLGSNFIGTVMTNTSITVGDSVTVQGRLLAGTGDVTLIHDTINNGNCAVLPAGSGGTTGGGTGATPGGPGGTGGTGGSNGTGGGSAVSTFAGVPNAVVAAPQTAG